MKVRLVVYGGVVVVACAILIAFWVDDARDQADRIARCQLWDANAGEMLRLTASRLRRPSGEGDNASSQSGFPPWTEWPADAQAEVRACGVEPLPTRELNGWTVTGFVAADRLDARWYYVTPADRTPGEPWAPVIAMNSKCCFVQKLPDDTEPVITRLTGARIDPLKLVERTLATHEHK